MAVVVGLDVGQRRDPTAIVIVEAVERAVTTSRYRSKSSEIHFLGRAAGRMPLGTSYETVIERVVDELWGLRESDPMSHPTIVVDETGGGILFVEMLRPVLPHGCRLVPVQITSKQTGGITYSGWERKVGKSFLISRLQVLLESGRLHWPKSARWGAVVDELKDFEMALTPSGNATFDARSGRHDDLVIALALAVLEEAVDRVPKEGQPPKPAITEGLLDERRVGF